MRSIEAYTDLPSCVAWFDTFGGLTLSGSQLTSWADQSGAGIVGPVSTAQAVANGVTGSVIGPTYAASNATFANKPTLTWGSGHTVMDMAALAADLAAPLTFLACGRFTGVPNVSLNGRFIFAGVNPGNAISAARRCAIDNPSTSAVTQGAPPLSLFYIAITGASTPESIVPCDSSVPFVTGFSFDAAGNVRAVFNRQIVRRVRPVSNTPRTHVGFRVGGSGGNSVTDGNWVGEMNALVCWNSFLTDRQILMASDLMMRRQGVTLATRSAKTRTALPAPGAVGGRFYLL